MFLTPQRSSRLLHGRQGGRARALINLVAPLAADVVATDMRTADTAGQLDLFALAESGAVAEPRIRPGDVESANDGRTRPTPATRGCRTSATATRTTTTRATRTGLAPSADRAAAALSFTEMLAADRDCRRNKATTPAAIAWERDQAVNLFDLHRELVDGTYTPGPSICFVITWPKPREVWAAGYRDRVVHHLVHRRIGKRFERAFIADSCACIDGRGTLYAGRRLEAKVRAITANWKRPAFYLKCDVASFFPSINKDTLAGLLERRIPEPFWLELAHQVLFHDPRPGAEVRGDPSKLALIPPEKSLFGRPAHLGLPIGNLSSQFGANVYLNELDQFVKHRLGVRHYIRYVDDFVLLHESPQQLNAWREEIEAFLASRLGLQLAAAKTILQPLERGVDFAGHVIKPHRRTLRRRALNGALRRLETMPRTDVYAAANSYLGLARQASHSHTDRTRICNVVRDRGFAVNHDLTKTYEGGTHGRT